MGEMSRSDTGVLREEQNRIRLVMPNMNYYFNSLLGGKILSL